MSLAAQWSDPESPAHLPNPLILVTRPCRKGILYKQIKQVSIL